MISNLEIRGFQIHTDTTIKLSKFATVLTGENDQGKSSVIRALRWLLLNVWDGKADQMMNWNAQEVSVKATIDGHEIIRRKNPKENVYVLDGGKPFEAVGAGKVPEAIARIVNVTEENFQEQHDPAFWFNLTAGQVAKSLNKIVNLEDIDSSMERIAVRVRSTKEELRISEQRYSEAKDTKDGLGWTTEADRKLRLLEDATDQMATDQEILTGLASRMNKLAQALSVKQNAAAVIQSGQQAIQLGQEYYCHTDKINELTSLVQQIEAQSDKIANIKEALTQAQQELKTLGGICKTCGRKFDEE